MTDRRDGKRPIEHQILTHLARVQAELRRLRDEGTICVICGDGVPGTIGNDARKTCGKPSCVKENRANVSREGKKRGYTPLGPRRVECCDCDGVFFTAPTNQNAMRCVECRVKENRKKSREYQQRKRDRGAA